MASANLTYPPTPDIAGQVRRRLAGQPKPHSTRLRRLAWGAALTVILLAGLLAVILMGTEMDITLLKQEQFSTLSMAFEDWSLAVARNPVAPLFY